MVWGCLAALGPGCLAVLVSWRFRSRTMIQSTAATFLTATWKTNRQASQTLDCRCYLTRVTQPGVICLHIQAVDFFKLYPENLFFHWFLNPVQFEFHQIIFHVVFLFVSLFLAHFIVLVGFYVFWFYCRFSHFVAACKEALRSTLWF